MALLGSGEKYAGLELYYSFFQKVVFNFGGNLEVLANAHKEFLFDEDLLPKKTNAFLVHFLEQVRRNSLDENQFTLNLELLNEFYSLRLHSCKASQLKTDKVLFQFVQTMDALTHLSRNPFQKPQFHKNLLDVLNRDSYLKVLQLIRTVEERNYHALAKKPAISLKELRCYLNNLAYLLFQFSMKSTQVAQG